MVRRVLLIAVLLMFPAVSYVQDATLSGTVSDTFTRRMFNRLQASVTYTLSQVKDATHMPSSTASGKRHTDCSQAAYISTNPGCGSVLRLARSALNNNMS